MTAHEMARAYRWTDQETDVPMPLLDRRRIIGSQAMLSHVRLQRGCLVPTHSHENEQFVCVLEGRMRFLIGKGDSPRREELILETGQVLHLPSLVPHAAEALEDSVVLDIFSPPSATTGIDRG